MNRNNIPLNITERENSKKHLIIAVFFMIFLGAAARYLNYLIIEKPAIDSEIASDEAQKEEEEYLANNYTQTATVVAVGNNTIDNNILTAGQRSSGNWNYDFLYEQVKDTIQASDLAIVSQTSPLTEDTSSVAGYPLYRTPAALADSLVQAGFNVIASASCHADDYGFSGISETLNIWNTKYPDVSVLGIHDSQESAEQIKIVTINNIKIALLNYTYGSNTNSLTEDTSYALDILDKSKVTQAVQNAKNQSDCVIFIAHWGETDDTVPTEFQKQWATYLMDLGVDVIIGNHPMSVQPYGTMADEADKQTTVFYSLGNFIAIEESPSRLLGGMAHFTIEKTVKDGSSSIKIINNSVEPLIMHYSYDTGKYASYFLENYTTDLAAQNSVYYAGYSISVDEMKQNFDEIMSTHIEPSTDFSLLSKSQTETENSEDDTDTESSDDPVSDASEDASYDNTYDSYYSYDNSYGYNNTYGYDNTYDYNNAYTYDNSYGYDNAYNETTSYYY